MGICRASIQGVAARTVSCAAVLLSAMIAIHKPAAERMGRACSRENTCVHNEWCTLYATIALTSYDS